MNFSIIKLQTAKYRQQKNTNNKERSLVIEEECVDELFFNLFPIIINGGALEASPGQVLGGFKLDYAKACGDIVCTHFVR